MSTQHTQGTAADGKTEIFNVPGHPLLVSAVEYNCMLAQRDELLEALIRLLPCAENECVMVGCNPNTDEDILFARAAIAKATGEKT